MEENRLIVGEIEEDSFVLTQFKNLSTQSVISKESLKEICNYLNKEIESGEQEHYITLNDQLPVRVSHEELEELLGELTIIHELLK